MSLIVLAATLSKLVTLVCTRCGYRRLVTRERADHRHCPRCGRQMEPPPER